MPPTDASTAADTPPGLAPAPDPAAAPDVAPHAPGTPAHAPDAPAQEPDAPAQEPVPGSPSVRSAPGPSSDSEDTQDIRLPDAFLAPPPAPIRPLRQTAGTTEEADAADPSGGDLLDGPGTWGPVRTPVGVLHLRPVRVARDLALVSRWMNDPAVAAFWGLEGPAAVAEAHLRRLCGGDGRGVPCLGYLDGVPMSYWELYRADLDPLARHYPARPHDTGLHLLVGEVADRGRGTGTALLRAVADLVLDRRPSCARVVAEPDLRNTPSVAAFLGAGFRFSAEVDLPGKRAALMVRDRGLRDVL